MRITIPSNPARYATREQADRAAIAAWRKQKAAR